MDICGNYFNRVSLLSKLWIFLNWYLLYRINNWYKGKHCLLFLQRSIIKFYFFIWSNLIQSLINNIWRRVILLILFISLMMLIEFLLLILIMWLLVWKLLIFNLPIFIVSCIIHPILLKLLLFRLDNFKKFGEVINFFHFCILNWILKFILISYSSFALLDFTKAYLCFIFIVKNDKQFYHLFVSYVLYFLYFTILYKI